jgi:hypothetical protein
MGTFRSNPRKSVFTRGSLVSFRVLCALLRLFLIICPDPSVFAAWREIFGANACFSNSFSNPFPLETVPFLP